MHNCSAIPKTTEHCVHTQKYLVKRKRSTKVASDDAYLFYIGTAYRAVNTLHFGYKNQSLNVL
jgi:hypothetical protein